MSWWVWVILGWTVLATVAGFWLGAVAAKQRSRERAWRRHQYETRAQDQAREGRRLGGNGQRAHREG